MSKVCSKCGNEKELSEYCFRKDTKNYRKDCKECRNKLRKTYYIENIEKQKEYHKEYRETHREEFNKKTKERYNTDENYRLHVLSKKSKYLGCSIEFFKEWLNFTKPYYVPIEYSGKLHIDHVIPKSLYNRNNEDELKKMRKLDK